MDVFARSEQVNEAQQAIRVLLSELLGNRQLLLACLLSGKRAWMNECRKAFRGMPIDDGVIESLWHYLEARKGPGNIAEEYEWLLAQQEVKAAAEQAEAAALVELAEKAHGKDKEAERGMWGQFPEQGAFRA